MKRLLCAVAAGVGGAVRAMGRHAKAGLCALGSLLGVGVVAPAMAQVTPYDGDPATAVGYFTAELYDAIPVVFGAIVVLLIVGWVWRSLKRAAGAKNGLTS